MAEKFSESVEQYLETILVLKQGKTVVRVKDISGRMQVSMPSVHSALHVLEDAGLIVHEKYGYVDLTPQGMALASRIYATHQLLVTFLCDVVGVSPATAECDACKIEHVISKETIDRIAAITKQPVKSAGATGNGGGLKGGGSVNRERIDLTVLDKGASACVVRVEGGGKEAGKLDAMGIVPGAIITKKSASLMQGPIVLAKGATQVAIGYEMARHIIVKPIEME
jgi:DtxR family transcriptional regulator, Mn-dependent transcriptional regulator